LPIGSEWDHCGLVVRLSSSSYEEFSRHQSSSSASIKNEPFKRFRVVSKKEKSILCLLECTGEGVTILPLVRRLRAYIYYKVWGNALLDMADIPVTNWHVIGV
jgi:hypothetical protein